MDALVVAGSVAGELRRLYGARLREVVLFGSWARGDADAESDIDLLVVLDEIGSVWRSRSGWTPSSGAIPSTTRPSSRRSRWPNPTLVEQARSCFGPERRGWP
ncbi:MAG: nucleotidyltransferase domain-containing protein [Actinobacteria bacterium]|nr:nucleotidyltransferase domain-containing protein [Actinomycetota bacterium]